MAVATAAATWVTLLSFYGPTQIALVAPLAGVVMMAALTATRRSLVLDMGVVGVIVCVVVAVQVDDWRLGLVGGLTSLAQAGLAVLVLRWKGRWPWQGPLLATVSDLPLMGVAVLVAAVGSSLLRWTGLGLVAPSDWDNVVLTAVRTMTWGLTLGALGLMWLTREQPSTRRQGARSAALLAETVLAALVTVATLTLAFPRAGALPVVFPLFLCIVWASVRTSPLAATSFAAVIGIIAVVGTLLELGSFAQVEDTRVGAILAQAFMLSLVVTALALALAVRDRDNAIRAAGALALEARDRAFERDLVLGSLAEGVVLFDEGGRIVLRNRAGRRMFGRDALPEPDSAPAADMLGLRELSGEPVAPTFIAELVASAHEVPSELVLRLDGPSSSSKVLSVRRQRVRLHDVGRSLVVVTFRDITQQHQHTKELEAFAGVLAHDLSRPLSVVHGWTEILHHEAMHADTLAASRVLHDTQRVLAASTAMRQLLEDLLALTLTDQRELRPAPVDVTALCRDLASMRADVRPGGVVEVEADLGVMGDVTLLRQLLDNLLANAFKYVPPGVAPAVTVRRGPAPHGWLSLQVQDNGVGIPARDVPHVFEDFYRSDQHRTAYQGTGIGLAICRRVVDRHGGRIAVTSSSPGSGTCIEISLPDAVHIDAHVATDASLS